ncbi:hypothetical protein E2C01_006822 [Portunus trituberculatus]|uniref:Uncharacterized protein n=1 Tax=Portunus trituberculatus TaxID=210409 RepID=A0A5B7CXB8_PORTR|nr:hypothetical protein [Portunus trituberculatus]
MLLGEEIQSQNTKSQIAYPFVKSPSLISPLIAPIAWSLTLDGEVLPLNTVVGEGKATVILRRLEGQHAGGGEDF